MIGFRCVNLRMGVKLGFAWVKLCVVVVYIPTNDRSANENDS